MREARIVVQFTLLGTPVAQGSLRSFALKVKGAETHARTVTTHANQAQLKPWRAALAAAAREQLGTMALLRGPVHLDMRFYFARPAAHYGSGRNAGRIRPSAPAEKLTRPDLDKLERAVLDALAGQVYAHDAQVTRIRAEKHYDEPERTEVWVSA